LPLLNRDMGALTSPKQLGSIGCCSTSRGILDWRSQARFLLSASFFARLVAATGDEENEALERCNYSGAATSKSQTHVRYDFFCARSVTRRMTSFTAPEGVHEFTKHKLIEGPTCSCLSLTPQQKFLPGI
jgi:hypothetical protein